VTLFKHGSQAAVVQEAGAAVGSDEEKAAVQENKASGADGVPGGDKSVKQQKKEEEEALAAQPKMHDVFSWQHLNYTVPVGHGETRQLLDDVSGYVVPGKLTALMGESGAGKVSHRTFLCP
jgi:ATP-binding cassette subfamily G (WHITE) protein 2 (SNQ2)